MRASAAMRLRRLAIRLLALAAVIGCAGTPTAATPPTAVRTPLPPAAPGTLALVGVNVVPMDADTVLADRTVIVRDGTIVAIEPSADADVPPDATVIDGRGGWLAPGLMDMHVHLQASDAEAYLRAGITTVRNMWGTPNVAALRREVQQGSARLPTIFSAGPGVDGPPPTWPYTVLVETAGAAEGAVSEHVDEGWDFIKVYQNLNREAYDAVLSRARQLGMTVVGHTPTRVGLGRVLESGQASVEHLGGYEVVLSGLGRGLGAWARIDAGRIEELAGRTASRGVWNCPTQVVVAELARRNLAPAEAEEAMANRRLVVRALAEAGAPLLAGTDAGIGLVPPGTSLAAELQDFVRAGLSPYRALRAATVDAAEFLGLGGSLGVVRVGARADLVLLSGNPLEQIFWVRAPVGVVLRGRWLTSGGDRPEDSEPPLP